MFDKAFEKIDSVMKEAEGKNIVTSFALIGGMAVSAWGLVRATKDIDFLVSLVKRESALSEFENILTKHKIKFTVHKGGYADPIGLLLDLQVPVRLEKVSVQLIIATKTWEEEFAQATIEVKMGKISIPVIKAEELIVMKLRAGGPLDIYDIQQLLKINKNKKDFNEKELRQKSKEMRLEKKLNKIIGD
ncbi:MAG: nucleotidyl transferase AbiEii/AbiGii toxin family protein [Elusimicrobia bacterium]|nr:nucleotidyl transferase AbiEii/AbiGii toxin family protein [Elusimicrobiota bacterium]